MLQSTRSPETIGTNKSFFTRIIFSCIISDSNFGANLAYYTYSGAYPFTQIIHRVFSLTLTGTLSYRQEHILSRSPFYSLSYRSDIYS